MDSDIAQLQLLALCLEAPSPEEALPLETLEPMTYQGISDWALLAPEAPESLFDETDALALTASGLKTYFDCPRKFFYQNLLNLQAESSEAANLGSIIHSLMEVFNQGFGQYPYTAERLRTLAEQCFGDEASQEELQALGFRAQDLRRIAALDPLSRHDLKTRLFLAIEDLEQKGFFSQAVQSLKVEEPFEFALEGLGRCRLKGRMDALVERPDGTWEIVDYKFYGPDRFSLKDPAKLADRLLSAFEPLPSGDLPHRERFKVSEAKPRDYQLPFYYLATQQTPGLQGKVSKVALQIIRPPFPENPQQGSIEVSVDPADMEARLPQLLADLNQYVVTPLLEGTEVPVNTGRHCLQCGYLFLCETKGQLELLEEALAEDTLA